jgi:hypothetical protein
MCACLSVERWRGSPGKSGAKRWSAGWQHFQSPENRPDKSNRSPLCCQGRASKKRASKMGGLPRSKVTTVMVEYFWTKRAGRNDVLSTRPTEPNKSERN